MGEKKAHVKSFCNYNSCNILL